MARRSSRRHGSGNLGVSSFISANRGIKKLTDVERKHLQSGGTAAAIHNARRANERKGIRFHEDGYKKSGRR